MKLILCLSMLLGLGFSCNKHVVSEEQLSDQELITKILKQEKFALDQALSDTESKASVFPRSLNASGEVIRVSKKDWTSGFYPGILWMTFEISKDEFWEKEAEKYTELLESEKNNRSNHDLGFKMMPSYGQGYRLTGNKAYREVLIQSAQTLITRFNEKVGCIRSWDHHKDKWEFPVIIDNLMNLELLFWASKETGDPVFSNIAVKHAQTTMENHFRTDFSSYHVVSYDTISGDAVVKQTHQGHADESSWARGQAWALYGFTMSYRETQTPDFLHQAEKIANYIFNVAKLPDDLIPYWDFSISDNPNEPRDVSAAAIMASALFELASYSEENSNLYLDKANKIMESLASKEYFNDIGSNGGYLLRHSTGSKPSDSEVDVPLIYADYYYLEALTRKPSLDKNN